MNKTKGKLIHILDHSEYEGVPTSWQIGICHLEVEQKENEVDGEMEDVTLHVYCRRPSLLIGLHGITINKIEEMLEMDIYIHEIQLTREKKDSKLIPKSQIDNYIKTIQDLSTNLTE